MTDGQGLTPAKWQERQQGSFTVEFSTLTGRIRAGRVDKAGKAFTAHNEVTGHALWAVAQWLEAHDDGEPYEIFADEESAQGYRLTVERIERADEMD
jgi:hypothetical protein